MRYFKTRIGLLNNTIAYYWGKPERRCVVNGSCQYTPTETSKGCAIGRLISLELAKSFYQESKVNEIYHMLPKELQVLGSGFLRSLQVLHDGGYLTDSRHEAVKERMEGFVDTSKIKFPKQ